MKSTSPTSTHTTDVVILGSGFAGSILALVLDKIGLDVVVLDKTRHPRFAIGESSTPIGNMILRDLADRYNLPRLKPLSTYGTWRDTYPDLLNGRKRGFSYFQHEPGRAFSPSDSHHNELLVTASTDDYRCDTHWLRADIDHFLVQEVKAAQIPVLEDTYVQTLLKPASPHERWQLMARQEQRPIDIRAKFVVDATGSAGLIPRHLNLPDLTDTLHTKSHALFSHFEDVPTWHDFSASRGAHTADHPFYCDDAALHQCIDKGWMWMLRFVNGRVSAGFGLDCATYRINYSVPPAQDWHALLARYPSLQQLFERATLAEQPGKLYRTGRLQRLWGQAAGDTWALLPHTTGFIDPMHSTGIAHSLSGIEHLAEIFSLFWDTPQWHDALTAYSERVIRELRFVDLLIAGCYPCFGTFDLLTTYTMLYFAAAITYEERRQNAHQTGEPFTHEFLCADERALVSTVAEMHTHLCTLNTNSQDTARQFRDTVKAAIAPYNTAGLFAPRINNMYEYTAADIG